MFDFSLTPPPAWTALGASWRALEARADGSFFQSWNWVGCRAAARFPDPLLFTARHGGETVALGLLNRRRRLPGGARLWLNETGSPALDIIHVEHNGLLMDRAAPPGMLAAALGWLARQAGSVVLSGVDAAHVAAARGAGLPLRSRGGAVASSWIDLAAVRAHPGGHLGLVSANARAQVRRSIRRYEAGGPLRLHRAGSLDEARSFLAALAALHQRTWTRRGHAGAFANPGFVAFHEELLEAVWPRGELDLLCIEAGGSALGYLYNFRWRDRISNYQTGFDYDAAASAQQKPGLTCHHLAAEHYAAEGLATYDLLAGEHRYKTSLATGADELHWVELMAPASLAGMLVRARAALMK